MGRKSTGQIIDRLINGDPRTSVKLTPDAQQTVEIIQRTGESIPATITRILETIGAIAPDFDEHYGPPRDGKGPSGK